MKRRVVMGVLVWAALWPLAHRALVMRFDFNPWKLGGMAMYTVPTPPLLAVLMTEQAGQLAPLAESTLPVALRSALDGFRAERHALGPWRKPDDVAAAAFETLPSLRFLLVVVQRSRLGRDSRIATEQSRFVYERDAAP